MERPKQSNFFPKQNKSHRRALAAPEMETEEPNPDGYRRKFMVHWSHYMCGFEEIST
jgi:hypothetical protein